MKKAIIVSLSLALTLGMSTVTFAKANSEINGAQHQSSSELSSNQMQNITKNTAKTKNMKDKAVCFSCVGH